MSTNLFSKFSFLLRENTPRLIVALKNYYYYKKQYLAFIQPALQRGECVCVCPAGLGDTLLFCEYQKFIEKKYQITCFLLLKPSHILVPFLCGIKNYASIQDIPSFLRWLVLYHRGTNLGYKNQLGFKVIHPQKSTIFIAHPDFLCLHHPKILRKEPPGRLYTRYMLTNFGLPEDTAQNPILNLDTIAPAPLHKATILLAPEASSLHLENATPLWTEIAKRLRDKGFQVVYNAINEDKNLSRYATWLNCNLEQAIAVAKSAQRIISVRSGLCDLIGSLGNKLTVLYPTLESYQNFGLEGMLGYRGVHEYVFKSTEQVLKQLNL